MIFHENHLPATILMKYHALFVIYEKGAKFDIIGGSLWVNFRLGVNYFEKVINYLQLHWKLFN